MNGLEIKEQDEFIGMCKLVKITVLVILEFFWLGHCKLYYSYLL